MSAPQNHAACVQAILAQHAATFTGFEPVPPPAPTGDDPVYRAALEAAATLGFIASDAECIARAWAVQAQRTGGFDAGHWPDDPRDFGLAERSGGAAFAPCPKALGLYAVLPDAGWVARMARSGVPTVQLRFKSDDPGAIAREVRAAVEAVAGTGARLFINDHWQEALAAGAYGVHLGQEDLDALAPQERERLRDSGLRLGVSTHGYAEMVRASQVRPSYLALGAVFPTTLKKMATAPQGLARLAAYARLARSYPLVAIGGIGLEQFPAVLATGVGSIAVVRALVAAGDPHAAADRLLQAMAEAAPPAA
ncbi:thiamine phosphate synthase [Melaminivora alkalimesophila]|uniref:Thiamine-phosphate diphosphorylase n=1 Tax=Melaminivora alkalimesophila TaxID=1165852 RepID=A0A317RB39_9BURK|nr:thiamine phosphate synthase [Melaminivora alkalimesophila]PWW45862.1 thiamine-phosphate diphosphorylase [Melaminivora alkalimesophila]